ncbi:protein-methionine-sulfoxide reductase heme-binding subunit MsrQ [Aliiglaciecola sp. LCG003]|uniref:protein-methionine-sulfoxide reductase heme-binding subunit MsrQ n=1 Tax=Aliiglaciecola sp. LCG003 TaxID=3053655 RepID=UPI0025726D81|nr:protein-methionine-sulfoxide reductase heme-binding subunit MsrQ [Aliiglaciecola sp. LCG003]WJG07707.1 protein-methionine-sulfoxide reductase heme-binding subunit MsrQ [Aliiglaciecola sp. LCG003]
MLKLSAKRIFWLKVVIHISCLAPIIWVYQLGLTDQLGGDPVEAILYFTGIGAFNILLISLCVSPLAKRFRLAALIRVRRLLGLYSFTYALAHFGSYIVFELQFEWQLLLSEIIKRPYITVGFVALCILLSLTASSTTWAQRKMGRKWQSLHNFVYVAAVLIALHYIWSVKSDIIQPSAYWLMVLILLWFRKDKLLRAWKR